MKKVIISLLMVFGVLLCSSFASAATCGDGFFESPETCDDGNTVSGDGCDELCQVENNSSGSSGGSSPSSVCVGAPFITDSYYCLNGGACTDPAYYDQYSCTSAGVCTAPNGSVALNGFGNHFTSSYSCLGEGTCTDPAYYDQSTCTSAGVCTAPNGSVAVNEFGNPLTSSYSCLGEGNCIDPNGNTAEDPWGGSYYSSTCASAGTCMAPNGSVALTPEGYQIGYESSCTSAGACTDPIHHVESSCTSAGHTWISAGNTWIFEGNTWVPLNTWSQTNNWTSAGNNWTLAGHTWTPANNTWEPATCANTPMACDSGGKFFANMIPPSSTTHYGGETVIPDYEAGSVATAPLKFHSLAKASDEGNDKITDISLSTSSASVGTNWNSLINCIASYSEDSRPTVLVDTSNNCAPFASNSFIVSFEKVAYLTEWGTIVGETQPGTVFKNTLVKIFDDGSEKSVAYLEAMGKPPLVSNSLIVTPVEGGKYNINFRPLTFSGYSIDNDTSLTINDSAEGSSVDVNNAVTFYAYYNNVSGGITGANCHLNTVGVTNQSMAHDGPNQRYYYTLVGGYNSAGTKNWNVSCEKSGEVSLFTEDTVVVTSGGAPPPPPPVPEFSDYAIALLLLTVVGGFIAMRRNQ